MSALCGRLPISIYSTKKYFASGSSIKCSVCPKCGEISLYIDNPEDIIN